MRADSIQQRLAIGPWFAEGQAAEVAETVLRQPRRFEELLECLLSPDKGTAKRASHSLTMVSEKRPDLLQPYKEIFFNQLEEQELWFIRYRLCKILPRLNLTPFDISRAAQLFHGLLEHPQNVLNVSALEGLGELARLDPGMREDTIWLIEQKMRTGTPAMAACGRKMLKRLHRKSRNPADALHRN